MSDVGILRVLGISGSVREGSYNKAALAAAGELMPDGMVLETIDIGDLPLYTDALWQAGEPAEVKRFRARIAAADAILFASPEFNFSVTAALKNALEWASRPPDPPLNWKPCAIFGVTMSAYGTLRGQYHLRQICASLNCFPVNVPQVDIPSGKGKFDEAGRLTDAPTRELVRQLLAELRVLTLRLRPA